MKYLKALLFICLSISCKKGEKDTIHLKDINILYGKWEMLTVKKTDTIVFNPCDANNKSIIINKDSIKIDYGQEEIRCRVLSKSYDKEENIYKFITSDNINLGCRIITSEISYWFINEHQFLFTKEKFVNKYKVVDQPCQECWGEECKEKEAEVRYDQLRDSLQNLNIQILEKWKGKYGFGFGGVHMGEEYEGGMSIVVSPDSSYINYYRETKNLETGKVISSKEEKNILAKVIRAEQDTLELQSIEDKKQYILYRINTDPWYAIRGHAVYMLSPPNNDYPLTKKD